MLVRKCCAFLTREGLISSSPGLPSSPSSSCPCDCPQDHVLVKEKEMVLLLRLKIGMYAPTHTCIHTHTYVSKFVKSTWMKIGSRQLTYDRQK